MRIRVESRLQIAKIDLSKKIGTSRPVSVNKPRLRQPQLFRVVSVHLAYLPAERIFSLYY